MNDVNVCEWYRNLLLQKCYLKKGLGQYRKNRQNAVK